MGTPGVKLNLSKEVLQETIKKHKGRIVYIAEDLKCNHKTVNNYINADPELKELLNDCRNRRDEILCESAVDTLQDAIDERRQDMPTALKASFYVLNSKGASRGFYSQHAQETNNAVKLTAEEVMKAINDQQSK